MNRYIIHVIVSCLFLPLFSLKAQDVVKAEYFIDVDPGYGNAINVDLNTGEDVSVDFDIDISQLQAGFHKLYFRALDADQNWSSVYIHPFYVSASEDIPALSDFEYFIDHDPGYGNAGREGLSGVDASLDFDVDISNLDEGFHKLYLRGRDAENNWSSVYVHPFFVFTKEVEASIVAFEYFVDEDPGEGQGTVLGISEPGTDVSAEFNIDLSSYTHGESHTLYIRAKDETGRWGFCYSGVFERNYITIYLNPEDAAVVADYGTYDIGETAEVSVTPNPEYNFINWTEDGTELSSDMTYSFELTGVHNLTANFELQMYEISATVYPAAGGSVEGSGSFRPDTTIELVAIPGEGYRFNNWTEGGEEVSDDSIYSFTVTTDRELQANFDLVEGIVDDAIASANIYPNPAKNFVMLQVPLQNNEEYVLTIVDLSGRQILKEQIAKTESRIDLADFNSGVYVVKVEKGDKEFVQRLVVE